MRPSLSLCALLLIACGTPKKSGSIVQTAPASFDVLVAGIATECCPTCAAIDLSIRNTSDAPVVIDWSSTRMEHNGAAAELVVDGPEPTIAPHTTWNGLLRPKPGAPHAASLEEGKLRNGRYSVHVAVQSGAARATSSTELNISYGAASTNPACPP